MRRLLTAYLFLRNKSVLAFIFVTVSTSPLINLSAADTESGSMGECPAVNIKPDNEGGKQRHGYTIHFEQDAFAFGEGKNEDRDYTQGTSVEWYGSRLAQAPFFNKPLDFIDNHVDKLLDACFKGNIADSITIGLKAYTPEDIGLTAPIDNDHPYVSYVFVTDSKTREFEHSAPGNRSYWRTAFTIGTLGNDVSRDFQTMIHQIDDMDDDRIPSGWDNQIEQLVVFNYQLSRLDNKQTRLNKYINSDFGTFWGGNMGTIFLDVFTGVSGRLGAFENEYVSLPGLDQSKNVEFYPVGKSMGDQSGGTSTKKCFWVYECYFFGSLTLKVVASNRLLEGYSGDPVRIPRSDLEPVVGLVGMGFTVKFTRHTTLSIAQFVRSNEFNSDRADIGRNHYYGGIYFVVDNPF